MNYKILKCDKHNHYKIIKKMLPWFYTTYNIRYFTDYRHKHLLNEPVVHSYLYKENEFFNDEQVKVVKLIGDTKSIVRYGHKIFPLMRIISGSNEVYKIAFAYKLNKEYKIFNTQKEAIEDILNQICKWKEVIL